MSIRKNDSVLITSGKDSGKTGIVERVFPNKNKCIVQGLHVFKKHQKPSKNYPHGGIQEISMPIDLSNVSLVCTHCKKTTRIKIKSIESGKQRVCKKCGETL